MPRVGAKYPKLSLVFREERTADIVRELAEGTLDAGLLALEADIGECVVGPRSERPLRRRAPEGTPARAQEARSRSRDLNDANVLLLDEGHCFREQALVPLHQGEGRRAGLPGDEPRDAGADGLERGGDHAPPVAGGAGGEPPRAARHPAVRASRLRGEPSRSSGVRSSPFAAMFVELAKTLRAASAALVGAHPSKRED